MPITPSMWPLDGTALQSSCSGTSPIVFFLVLSSLTYHFSSYSYAWPSSTNPLNLWSQGSLREGSGHVVSGLHLRRAE